MLRTLIILTAFVFIVNKNHAQLQRFSVTKEKMASPCTLIIYSSDSVQAAHAFSTAFGLIDSLAAIFTDYTDSSELNLLCATAGSLQDFCCSPALFEILWRSKEAYRLSGGYFDITLGPLTRRWRRARKEKVFPTATDVQDARKKTGGQYLLLNAATHTAKLLMPGMQLDLGGIAQGYIAQKVIAQLNTSGISNALVDISGDIVCSGHPPGADGWTVAINLPRSEHDVLEKQLQLRAKAVTTSGDLYQYLEHNGQRYSHIIDPKTGLGSTLQRNVTVLADDGTTADWLTKACSLLPVMQAMRLARRLHAELLIATIVDGKPVMHTSKGFSAFWKNVPLTGSGPLPANKQQ